MMDISSEDDSQVKSYVLCTLSTLYLHSQFYESTCHKYYEYYSMCYVAFLEHPSRTVAGYVQYVGYI